MPPNEDLALTASPLLERIAMASTTVEDLEVLARLLSLPIPLEHRASVLAQFERLLAIAESLDAFPLPPEVEPATVFSNDRP